MKNGGVDPVVCDGGIQRAGTGKNKKVTEISPPASILAWGPGNKISLNIYNVSQKWAFFKVICFEQLKY
jgi:hypothetical protein